MSINLNGIRAKSLSLLLREDIRKKSPFQDCIGRIRLYRYGGLIEIGGDPKDVRGVVVVTSVAVDDIRITKVRAVVAAFRPFPY